MRTAVRSSRHPSCLLISLLTVHTAAATLPTCALQEVKDLLAGVGEMDGDALGALITR